MFRPSQTGNSSICIMEGYLNFGDAQRWASTISITEE